MINSNLSNKGYSQRQLRVGELVKQSIGEIFIKNETKISSFNSRFVTVTEVRMTPDLKTSRVYVIPLGGIDMKEIVGVLTDNAHLVRKALSKKLSLKFLPKLNFIEDKSFKNISFFKDSKVYNVKEKNGQIVEEPLDMTNIF